MPLGRTGWVSSIMMSCRHFLSYMSTLVVTMLKSCFVDFVFPFVPIITPGHLLVSPAHHSLTGLLVTLSPFLFLI